MQLLGDVYNIIFWATNQNLQFPYSQGKRRLQAVHVG